MCLPKTTSHFGGVISRRVIYRKTTPLSQFLLRKLKVCFHQVHLVAHGSPLFCKSI